MTFRPPALRALAAVLALAACVSTNDTLSAADRSEIGRLVPGAQLDGLTRTQITQLQQALHNGDGFDTAYDIQSILAR